MIFDFLINEFTSNTLRGTKSLGVKSGKFEKSLKLCVEFSHESFDLSSCHLTCVQKVPLLILFCNRSSSLHILEYLPGASFVPHKDIQESQESHIHSSL